VPQSKVRPERLTGKVLAQPVKFYGNLYFNRDRQDLQDNKTRFTMKNMKLGTRENVFNHEKHEKTRKKSVSELWRVFPPH